MRSVEVETDKPPISFRACPAAGIGEEEVSMPAKRKTTKSKPKLKAVMKKKVAKKKKK
jgi:hypothetical protein